MAIGRFLGGIAGLLYDSETEAYLLMRRAAHRDVGAGHWECVTGRLEQGEGYETALHREVREELGVAVTIEFIIGTSHFYRGAPVPENELLGLIYCCSTPDPSAVAISAEHSESRWVTAAEAATFLDPQRWLYKSIARAEQIRALTPPALREVFRQHGFETST